MQLSIPKNTLRRITAFLLAYVAGVAVTCLLDGKITPSPFLTMGFVVAFIAFGGKKKKVKAD